MASASNNSPLAMRRLLPALLLSLLLAVAAAQAGAAAPAAAARPDSGRMERDMQRLPWKQFRSVIESIPKLKADIEAYGPFGWEYVRANYATYAWHRNIDKLDDDQRQRLAELIRAAKAAAGAKAPPPPADASP
jgi:hypothetical protein